MRFALVAFGAVALAGCGTSHLGQHVYTHDEDVDADGPVITADPLVDPQPFGQSVVLSAHADDEGSGVVVFEVLYRRETDAAYDRHAMQLVGDDLYQGQLSGQDVASGGMFYYFHAVDAEGNESCLPEGCSDEAWHFAVVAD